MYVRELHRDAIVKINITLNRCHHTTSPPPRSYHLMQARCSHLTKFAWEIIIIIISLLPNHVSGMHQYAACSYFLIIKCKQIADSIFCLHDFKRRRRENIFIAIFVLILFFLLVVVVICVILILLVFSLITKTNMPVMTSIVSLSLSLNSIICSIYERHHKSQILISKKKRVSEWAHICNYNHTIAF